ncbi:cytochrome P460 family protein [Bradyrhizobium sp. Arg68]|uniref:cytochrome P460 family protein n=1 Tax=Bradyrhizobium ivorense TaxID=2511166 RepID=UPI001E3FA9CE|nr:cytochrome P460 family protein [Bradyrhizobium ivorense]MCC8934994.1 cytochrome P460 family protein [Bradyrhizobium ivorense]
MRIIQGAAVGLVMFAAVAALAEHEATEAGAQAAVAGGGTAVDSEGRLHVPDDYRRTYQLLGSWAIAADDGRGSKEIHVVYASPGTIDAFQKDQRFPDGAVLVKEVFKTATGELTTGTVSHADALKGWFVMVKDATNRYPGNALWGDGWGWSWLNAADPSKTTTINYKAECRTCHVPARASDWVYLDGYPSLKR